MVRYSSSILLHYRAQKAQDVRATQPRTDEQKNSINRDRSSEHNEPTSDAITDSSLTRWNGVRSLAAPDPACLGTGARRMVLLSNHFAGSIQEYTWNSERFFLPFFFGGKFATETILFSLFFLYKEAPDVKRKQTG